MQYAYQKDAKVAWSIVLCLDISSMVTITIPSSHHACVVGPRPCSTCILDHNIGISIYSGTSLKGLSELRTQYKKPPY